MAKQVVRRTIDTVSPYDISGSIDSIITILTALKTKALNMGYANISIDVNSNDSGVDSYILEGDRLETDKEESVRLEREAKIEQERLKIKLKNEKNEKLILKRLAKKYKVSIPDTLE